MPKIISYANQKGGVGKSTLCIQQAYHLCEKGFNVLVIDMDGQGNSSSRLSNSADETFLSGTTKTSQLFETDLKEVVPLKCNNGIDLIYTPKNDPELFEMESAPITVAKNPKRNCEELFKNYDYVLIDCPPSLGRKLVAALIMSSHVISPIKLSGFAVDGLEGLFNTIISIQSLYNPDLDIIGVVVNDMDRSVSHARALTKLREDIPSLVLNNIIMHRTPLDTATSEGVPVWTLGYAHVAARETRAVLDEIIERTNKAM